MRHRNKALSAFLPLLVSIAIATYWSFTALRPNYTTSQPALDVWMLDVGQGEAVLAREPGGKTLLFDGGPDSSVLNEIGGILPPWDTTIDLAILSHNHADHIRGLIEVLKRYTVKEIWISGAIHTTADYAEFLRLLQERPDPPKVVFFDRSACAETAECPVAVPFGQATLQVYHPLENMTGKRPEDQHDATVMVKLRYAATSIMLTGDLDEGHEQAIVAACQPPKCTLQATILQIPHHGSASGLAPAFLSAINPKAALIPVGEGNKFGHPTAVVLKRLDEAGIPTYRTDRQGRIHAVLDGSGYTVSTAR